MVRYSDSQLKELLDKIVAAIDLNYILAEAVRYRYTVKLLTGEYADGLKWHQDSTLILPLTFELALGKLQTYLNTHIDKLIKISIVSDDVFTPFTRNTIINLPYKFDISKIKKESVGIVIIED